jgi:hypothetical protein
MYGPPEYPRATNSPTIILLVSGLAALLGFLLGVFVGFGAGETSGSPEPRVTVTVEDTTPPGEPEVSQSATAPAQTGPTQTGPAQTGPTQTGPAQTGPTQTGPTQTGPAQTGPAQTGVPQAGASRPPITGSAAASMKTFVVGVDLRPGTYRTTGPVPGSTNCFWARMRSTATSLDDVITAGAPTGPATVTIEPTDKAFQTAGCAVWTKA